MLKRKNVKTYGLSRPSGVATTLETVTTDEVRDDGNVFKRVSVQEVPVSEVDAKLGVISPDEYTLENLMKAGVSLDQVNLNGFMAPTDKAVIADIADENSTKAFDVLLDEEYKAAAKKTKVNNVENNVETEITE